MAHDDEPAASFSGRIGRDRGGPRVAVGLVAVLGIGIAAAIVSGSPDETAKASIAPSPSAEAAAPAPLAQPTSNLECDPIDPTGTVPFFRLGSSADPIGVRGLLGMTRGPSDDAEPDRGWVVPDPEVAIAVGPGDRLFLVLGTADCIESANVGWQAVGDTDVPAEADLFRVTYATDRPTSDVAVEFAGAADLAALGVESRDFALRIHVGWWPDANPRRVGGESWTVLYFRVRISSEPVATPVPRPMVTPAVPCKFFVAEGGVGARLFVPGGSPVFGPADPADAPLVVAPETLPFVIGLDGDGCAIEWNIAYLDQAGNEAVIESVGNVTGDPGLVAQNRWTVFQPAPGEWLLRFRYRSSAASDWLEAWWRVVGSGE